MKRKTTAYTLIFTIALLATACSTTRVLGDGEYSLAGTKVNVTNRTKDFKEAGLAAYIKQKPNSNFIFGWNPFVSVYNWSNGKGKGWDKFVQKLGVAPIIYDPELVDESVENLEKHLEYIGYYGSKVDSKIHVRKKKVYVTYDITLGERYRIDSIAYRLPERGELAADFLADVSNSTVKVGDWLSEAALESETVRSTSVLRNKGWFGFNKNYFFCEADTLGTPGAARLQISLNEYTRNETPKETAPFRRFTFADVNISYPSKLKVRKGVLEELTTVRPGDVYSENAVNQTYSRLSSLRMFSGVNIGVSPVDSSRLNCDISLTPSKLQGFKVNVEASVNSSGLFGVSPQLSWYHKNIFRGGEWLNLSFMGNFQFKFRDNVHSNEFGVSGGLSFPKFLFLPYRLFEGTISRTDINASYNYQSRPEYTRNIISTSLGFNGNVNSKFYYQVYPAQLSIIHIFNLDSAFLENLKSDPFLQNAYQDHFDLGAGGTFYYTTNSDVNPKTSYEYVRLQTDISGNVLSAFKGLMKKDGNGSGMIWNTPYSQYVRAELTLGKTWRFGKDDKQGLATRVQAGAGYAYGNSTALPFEKHFYAGGANSMRGWQARSLGPGLAAKDTTFVIPNQTGDMKLEANIEYRFPMFWMFSGAVFVDAGNVWNLKRSDRPDEQQDLAHINGTSLWTGMAMNWGLGLRLDLDFLILRVDWGMRLHDPARQRGSCWLNPRQWLERNGYALHFGVGYPF